MVYYYYYYKCGWSGHKVKDPVIERYAQARYIIEIPVERLQFKDARAVLVARLRYYNICANAKPPVPLRGKYEIPFIFCIRTEEKKNNNNKKKKGKRI